jgi:hypothetical protein
VTAGAGGKRDNPEDNPTSSQVLPVVVGVAALGGAAYLFTRPAQAAMLPVTTAPAELPRPALHRTPTPHGATTETPAPDDSSFATSAHPTSSSDLITRLNTNNGARQLFAFQALLYSSHYTDYLPDGLIGDHTRTMIADINRRAGDTTSSDDFGPGMYARAELTRVANGKPLDRLIPPLPQATITAVNNTIRGMAAGPLLQVHAT